MPSILESRFMWAWSRWGDPALPKPTLEFRFHPTRKWRWDAAWPQYKVAVDIQGGTFIHGKHSRGGRQTDDFDKMNAAAQLGWCVIHLDTTMLTKQQIRLRKTIDLVCSILHQSIRFSQMPARNPLFPRAQKLPATQHSPFAANTNDQIRTKPRILPPKHTPQLAKPLRRPR